MSRLERRVVQAVRVACDIGRPARPPLRPGPAARVCRRRPRLPTGGERGPAIPARAPTAPRPAEWSGPPRAPSATKAGTWTCWTNSWTKNGLPSDSRAMARARACGGRFKGGRPLGRQLAQGQFLCLRLGQRRYHQFTLFDARHRAFLGPAESLQERARFRQFAPIRAEQEKRGWIRRLQHRPPAWPRCRHLPIASHR